MGATCRRQEPVRRRLAAAPAVYTTPTPAGLGLCRWLASEQCRPAWQRCLPLRLCPMGSLPRRRRPSSRPGARWSPLAPHCLTGGKMSMLSQRLCSAFISLANHTLPSAPRPQ